MSKWVQQYGNRCLGLYGVAGCVKNNKGGGLQVVAGHEDRGDMSTKYPSSRHTEEEAIHPYE
jgi:hypothetical protein